MKECYLCHRIGQTERHHVFSGSYRKAADRLGLVVDLCPECHRYIHSGNGAAVKKILAMDIQKKYMTEHETGLSEWIALMGKSWI